MNHPFGSDIANGRLYVVDIDTVRWFDGKTGQPLGSLPVAGATRLNDLEVAPDGTIYATQTGDMNAASWKVYKVTPQGETSVFVSGAPLNLPNGIAFDPKGTSSW